MKTKKLKLSLSLLLTTNLIFAQITLENTYSGNIIVVNLSNSGYKYWFVDPNNSQIKLYNLNHSLWKTINVPSISGYSISSVGLISETLFNTNPNDVEYYVLYSATTSTPTLNNYKFRIVDEYGSIILDNTYTSIYNISPAVRFVGGNNFKLSLMILLPSIQYTTEIYSLPGTYPLQYVKNNTLENNEIIPYPNPTEKIIHIPINLDHNDKIAHLYILDLNGKVLDSYKVDGTFNDFIFDTSNYPNGIYLYEIESNGKIISRNKFVIEK